MPGEDNDISYQPKYLDKNVLNTPAVALGLATKEVVGWGTWLWKISGNQL